MKNSIIISFFLIGLILCNSSCIKRGILVHIQNDSQSNVKTVVVQFTGGEFTLPELPAQKEYERKVYPKGESALTITFNVKQKSYSHLLDVYIEPNFTGNIFIKIGENGEINYTSDVRLDIFPN